MKTRGEAIAATLRTAPLGYTVVATDADYEAAQAALSLDAAVAEAEAEAIVSEAAADYAVSPLTKRERCVAWLWHAAAAMG